MSHLLRRVCFDVFFLAQSASYLMCAVAVASIHARLSGRQGRMMHAKQQGRRGGGGKDAVGLDAGWMLTPLAGAKYSTQQMSSNAGRAARYATSPSCCIGLFLLFINCSRSRTGLAQFVAVGFYIVAKRIPVRTRGPCGARAKARNGNVCERKMGIHGAGE